MTDHTLHRGLTRTSCAEQPVLFSFPSTREPPYVKGHRQRLRDRFIRGGAEALPDYELLELVIFRAISRQDVKPLVYRLLKQFGDFNGVISAPRDVLLLQKGVTDRVVQELKVVEAAAHRLAHAQIIDKPILSSWSSLLKYCQTTLAHKPVEEFRVFFLDRKNRLIADERLGRGTIDHVPVYPREIVKRALQLDASALILVHNHPSGDPTPSPQDIDTTQKVIEATGPLGIIVHDHLVIGKSKEISFRSEGLMDRTV